MPQQFTAEAWQRNAGVYAQIEACPFNRELAGGTLTPERFRHYIVQDAHYLEGFARTLSLVSAKGHDAGHVVHFAKAAEIAVVVERTLHRDYFQRFGVSTEAFAASEPTPVCEHYVSWLLRTAALEPFEVALAAVLPCFRVYRDVGRSIHAAAGEPNPYRAWIDTYAGDDFDRAVEAVLAIADGVAAEASPRTVDRMHRAFGRAMQLEWMFWDSAYALRGWPV